MPKQIKADLDQVVEAVINEMHIHIGEHTSMELCEQDIRHALEQFVVEEDSESSKSDIYKMKLHDVIVIHQKSKDHTATNCYGITRVAGGWIYHIWNPEKQEYIRDVFVQFDNEFQCAPTKGGSNG